MELITCLNRISAGPGRKHLMRRWLLACWLTFSLLLTRLSASDESTEISPSSSQISKTPTTNSTAPASEMESNKILDDSELEARLSSLFHSIMKGDLTALPGHFSVFSAPEAVHFMDYHWQVIKYLLTNPELEVVECINELNSAESPEDYDKKSAALDVRECIFEYLCFAVESEARFGTFSQNKEHILEVLRIIIEQHRLPCMFKVIFSQAAPLLSLKEIGDLIDFTVEKSTFVANGSVLPVNFELLIVLVNYAPEAFEQWLLKLYDAGIDYDWLLYMPLYFILSQREISPVLHARLSGFSFTMSLEGMRVLDAYITASGFTELYAHVGTPNYAEVDRMIKVFRFILGRFEHSQQEQEIDLQWFVVENRLYALMEAMLLLDTFSFQDPEIITEIILYAIDFPATQIEWFPLMLINTYREIDLKALQRLVSASKNNEPEAVGFCARLKLNQIIWLFNSIDLVTGTFSFRSRLRSDSGSDDLAVENGKSTEDSGTIVVDWNEPEAFYQVIKSKVTDTTVALFTSFLIRYVLANYFMIPFSAVKFKASELVFMWRTVLGHINFFISSTATKYDRAQYIIKGKCLQFIEEF